MAQRTPLQAYQEIKAALVAGTCNPKEMDGSCVYRRPSDTSPTGFIHCGVGVLFSPVQLDDIRAKEMINYNINDVAERIGEKNIVEVTGLPMHALVALQNKHDRASSRKTSLSEFEQYIERKIAIHS